ncbi:MAG: efflux RND transporter periplasmic adaptor subunit [Bacteroidales bacterium]|nr:efflux RND transporter periplasmic adaptor subunit [Candidatus Colicola coprequi]
MIALVAVVVVVALVGVFAIQPEEILITGEAEATEYRVSGKIPGRIDMFLAEEGDRVHKGDTLVIINSPELLAKKDQAMAARSAAEAQNQKAIHGARKEQIEGAYELLQKAKVGEDVYRKSYERVSAMYEKGVLSAQKKDEVEAQYKAAVATRRAAETQYRMALNGAQDEDKMAAQALVDRADGAIKEVMSYESELFLTSPVDGEVSARYPKVGELVGQGAPIMSVIDLTDTWFTFAIREDMLRDIHIDTQLMIRIPALGDNIYPVRVTYIQVMASYATWRATKANGEYDVKTFNVKARPIADIPNLRPGMTAIVVR